MFTKADSPAFALADDAAPAWLAQDSVSDLAAFESPTGKSGRLESGARGISKRDIAELTAQLGIMTQSGVDIGTALGSLASQCQRPALGTILQSVHDDVMAGASFSEALRKHNKIFDEAFTATVAAGEATGKMAEVLSQLADLQRSELRLLRTIRGVMIYPIVLMVVSVGVILAMMTFVLPQFAGIFEQYEVPLPGITQALIFISDELRTRWWLWGPLGVAAIAGIVSLRTTQAGRSLSDPLMLKVAVLKRVVQTVIVGRICRLLGLMIDSGVPLLEGLNITQKAVRHTSFRLLLRDLEEAVTNGRGLSSALQSSDIFPAAATEMIGSAERSGKLGDVLRMIGAYYEEEGEAATKQAASMLEPLITVCMGAVVAVIVLAVMLPVFDLSSISH